MEFSRTYLRFQARGEALGVHFELGLRGYEQGDPQAVSRHCSAIGMLPEGGIRCPAYLALRWRELWLSERYDEALEVARRAARLDLEDVDAELELADVLQALERDEEAADELMEAARRHVDEPDLWYEAGLAAERAERGADRLSCFRRVWELEHDVEPAERLWMSEQRFVEVAEEALGRLPEHLAAELGNLAILVETYPDAWILETEIADPRILGFFDGLPRADEQSLDAMHAGPARIHLFRWNIERQCATPEEAEEQVAVTVLHEVGHYMGLDEEDLDYLGLG